ncbi:MAG: hypothetical protein J5685_09400 [Clostridiales bacterium]|nr:hypothetical protein [Clostridiales bacterium]
MARKTNKKAVAFLITLAVISLIVILGAFFHAIFPHYETFENVYNCGDIPGFHYISEKDLDRDDHPYHYICSDILTSYYVDSYVELEKSYDDNEPDDMYSLGEQDLKVKATGVRFYYTDIMGMMVHYPVIVYEYAG